MIKIFFKVKVHDYGNNRLLYIPEELHQFFRPKEDWFYNDKEGICISKTIASDKVVRVYSSSNLCIRFPKKTINSIRLNTTYLMYTMDGLTFWFDEVDEE